MIRTQCTQVYKNHKQKLILRREKQFAITSTIHVQIEKCSGMQVINNL